MYQLKINFKNIAANRGAMFSSNFVVSDQVFFLHVDTWIIL